MIKLKRGQLKTWTIENGKCMPRNEVSGLTIKDLSSLYTKIGRILDRQKLTI